MLPGSSASSASAVVAFCKTFSPINLNVINVGVEGHFYSVEAESTLDEATTDFELNLEPVVSTLELGSSRLVTETAAIAQYIANLELRTRHLRQSLLSMGASAVQMLVSCLNVRNQ
jgi:hypothetical protein